MLMIERMARAIAVMRAQPTDESQHPDTQWPRYSAEAAAMISALHKNPVTHDFAAGAERQIFAANDE